MSDFSATFAALKGLIAPYAERLAVKTDSPSVYWLATKGPSPFPQHKGQPLDVTWVQIGKSYVSLHLMPIYMAPKLIAAMSPGLKKRMQGKTCFNFKAPPDTETLVELTALVEASIASWKQ